MPIKRENRARYPADWKEVRARILQRAGGRCEQPTCGARNYDVGTWRSDDAGEWRWECWRAHETHREARLYSDGLERGAVRRPTVIVLTIAHLDHQPENCEPANLRAYCQRHHLEHDRAHHRANALQTRADRRGLRSLFS